MENIVLDNIRIQLLCDDIVRIEYSRNGLFCDDDTFFVPNRTNFTEHVAYTQEANIIRFGEYELYIPEDAKSLYGVHLDKNGRNIYRYKKQKNNGELPKPDKTPEVFVLSDTPRIVIPVGGYSQKRKGQYKVKENAQDIYLLFCQRDAKKLRKLYVELTGAPELVRLSTLGAWNSKYYAYSESEAKQLILDYERHNIPIDNMVIDTDWRSCRNGWGYDVNKRLFPNVKRFLDFAHTRGVEVTFNDHPEPVDKSHVFKTKEIAYREKNLQALMQKGLDVWWYDRNWSTSLISPSKNLRAETLGLYLFSDITAHFYQKKACSTTIYRRPVIMGNVVNIVNGCNFGILDSASHRYSIQWTGDIDSSLQTLATEVENLISASNNCVPYINSDCGGHLGNPTKEEFVRWMQFGVLSPVFRPHCTNIVERFREPWVYDDDTLDIVREYINLRYRLLPIIYKSAYESYANGTPIFSSMAMQYPDDKRASAVDNAYMLGNDVLIRPIAKEKIITVPKRDFVKPVTAVYYDGTELAGEVIATAKYDHLNIRLSNTSPLKNVPIYNFSARFDAEIKFEKAVKLYVRSDDGCTVWIDGEKVLEDKSCHSALMRYLMDVLPGETHKITIEYFQAGGDACIELCCSEIESSNEIKTYLPQGKWVDVFSGKIYAGQRIVKRVYSLEEMPLFVRLGACVPLAYNAKNTKEQLWNALVFDYYPSNVSGDSGYIYEDDTETTAYKTGACRKTPYATNFSEDENAYVVRVFSSKGEFNGNKCFDKRTIGIKMHLVDGIKRVVKVLVKGQRVDYETIRKDEESFVFTCDKRARDADVVYVSFVADADKEYDVKFFV